MHNASVDILVGATTNYMIFHLLGRGINQSKAILQLIAESIGAAALIEGASGIKPTGGHLIGQEEIEHPVGPLVLSLYPDFWQEALGKFPCL